MAKPKKSRLFRNIFLILLCFIAVFILLQRDWIYDFYRGITYEPSSEMAAIRTKLKLTSQGEFLFNASQPSLNSADEFNANCRRENETIAVLGCYSGGDIFIYNITDSELDGVRELTTAHELLHVVFARMSEDDRESFRAILETVYNQNRDILESELETYDESARFEELYVRAGTEVKNLPSALEDHYAKYFTNQDHIVDFYNSYIQVFREIEAEIEALSVEMEELQATIEADTASYERRADQLNANIISFNSCADTAGCFSTNAAFRARRNELLAEADALEELYEKINANIEKYNEYVAKYNEYVTRNEKLNTIINSSIKPESI